MHYSSKYVFLNFTIHISFTNKKFAFCVVFVERLLLDYIFLLFGYLHVPLIALCYFIETHGTDLSIGVRLLGGETLLQEKNSTGRR